MEGARSQPGLPTPYQEVRAGAPFPVPVLFPAGFGHHLLAGNGGDEADAREPLAGQETRLETGRNPQDQPHSPVTPGCTLEGLWASSPLLLGPDGRFGKISREIWDDPGEIGDDLRGNLG